MSTMGFSKEALLLTMANVADLQKVAGALQLDDRDPQVLSLIYGMAMQNDAILQTPSQQCCGGGCNSANTDESDGSLNIKEN